MANIRKSFNFRNGVQVDNNNFVVNPNGLVGIGSSAPTVKLDVAGGVKVSGLVTSSTLGSGIGTITNFTATNASVGVLTATTLSIGGNTVTNLIGFGFTTFISDNGGVGLHTTSKLGINTTTSPGASDSELTVNGNTNITGIVTANSFSGDLNGNVTSTSGFSTFTELKVGTAITMSAGTISATTFSGSLPASSLTGTISSTQIANSAVTDAKIDTVSASKLTGALPAISGASLTNVPAVSITGSPNVNLGVTTTGNLTAGSITGAGLSVTSIGIGTAIPANIFQQRATGATELQVTSDTASASITVGREPGTANTNNAEFRYGGAGGFAFSNAQSLDIVNYGTGNFNYYLSANNAGSAAGDYVWHKGANSDQLMTLTKGGNLGIGITNPEEKLNVQGASKFTGIATFNNNVTITGSLTATFKGNLLDTSDNIIVNVSDKLFNGNVNTASGISTFNQLSIGSTVTSDNITVGGASASHASPDHIFSVNNSTNRFYVNQTGAIGISTTLNLGVSIGINATDKFAVFGGVGVGTTSPRSAVDFADAGTVGIGITQPYFLPPKLTTSTRNGIGGTITGATIYNTNLNKLQVYTGSNWETVTSS